MPLQIYLRMIIEWLPTLSRRRSRRARRGGTPSVSRAPPAPPRCGRRSWRWWRPSGWGTPRAWSLAAPVAPSPACTEISGLAMRTEGEANIWYIWYIPLFVVSNGQCTLSATTSWLGGHTVKRLMSSSVHFLVWFSACFSLVRYTFFSNSMYFLVWFNVFFSLVQCIF